MEKYDYFYNIGIKVCNFLSKKYPQDNFLICPNTVFIALSFLYYGSDGNTKEEIISFIKTSEESVLHMEDLFWNHFVRCIPKNMWKLNPNKEKNLYKLENKVYFNGVLKQTYSDFIKSKLYSKFNLLNVDDLEQDINSINKWAATITMKNDECMVLPKDITVNTSIIFLSTALFKGQWKNGFNTFFTSQKKFFVTPENYKVVPMMKCQYEFYYLKKYKNLFSIIKVPYKWIEFTAYFILPDEGVSIEKCFECLMEENFYMNFQINKMYGTIRLKLPKFELKYTLSLKNTLESIGLNKIFSRNCDLSKMSLEKLFVSDIIQSSYFETDEDGYNTDIEPKKDIIKYVGYSRNYIHKFNFNRPFIVFIRKANPGVPAFISAVRNP